MFRHIVQEPPITNPAEATQNLPNRQHRDNSQSTGEEEATLQLGIRPLSNLSSSSGNTEESLSALADQTLRTLAHSDPSLDISFLTAPGENSQQKELEPTASKVSESEVPITIQPGIQKLMLSSKVPPDCLTLAFSIYLKSDRGTISRQMRVR